MRSFLKNIKDSIMNSLFITRMPYKLDKLLVEKQAIMSSL
jgi:hypothetical protein